MDILKARAANYRRFIREYPALWAGRRLWRYLYELTIEAHEAQGDDFLLPLNPDWRVWVQTSNETMERVHDVEARQGESFAQSLLRAVNSTSDTQSIDYVFVDRPEPAYGSFYRWITIYRPPKGRSLADFLKETDSRFVELRQRLCPIS